MGAAQSRDDADFEVGFLPEYHWMKLNDADMTRLFIPRNFMYRCSMHDGCSVALVDCLGRRHHAEVEECEDAYFLGTGWADFLEKIGAQRGDYVLFKFRSVRTSQVLLFSDVFGWQKYPFVDEQHRDRVLEPREQSCFFSSGWPFPSSPSRALAAGPCTRAVVSETASEASTSAVPLQRYVEACNGAVCNATGRGIKPTMVEFFNHIADSIDLEVPLYYCRLGIVELECGVLSLNKDYSTRYILPMMRDCSHIISIRKGSDDEPIHAKLSESDDGVVHIAEGWARFMEHQHQQQAPGQEYTECVLRFHRFVTSITVVTYLF